MFDLDKWQEILATMRMHKLRTLLTAFGVFWGIFMLVLLQASGNGLENGVLRGFNGRATNSFFIWGQKTTKPYAGLQPGRQMRLTNEDTDALRTNLPQVQTVAPRLSLGGFGDGNDGGTTVSYGAKKQTLSILGEVPDVMRVQPKRILKGRFLDQPDLDEFRKVAIISSSTAEAFFGKDENPLGKYVYLRGLYFEVVGVFGSYLKGEDAVRDLRSVILPFNTFQRVFSYGNRVDTYSIQAAAGVPATLAEAKTKALLASRHSVSPDDRAAFGSFNLEEEFQKFQNLFAGIRIFLWIVGTGTLVAGIVGVSNIMIITVQERTKEIGVRKALGATPWSVVSQILQEAVVLTALAGYAGLSAGVLLTEGLNQLLQQNDDGSGFFYNPTIDFKMALSAMLLLVVAGGLAGLIPARRAAAVQPIEALRAD